VRRERKLRSLPDGTLHSVGIERSGDGYRVEFEDRGSAASLVRAPEVRIWSVVSESGLSFEVLVERRESEIEVVLGQSRFRFASGAGSGRQHHGQSAGRLEVKSPMPGKVVRILVSAGETVVAGQPILLFEAMKMQNELRSPQDGIVARIDVQPGQAVEAREALYILEAS
jgi:biotin carboxyl carrier protein